MSESTTIDPAPVLPLAYAEPQRRPDSVFGIIGLAIGLLCATVPGVMVWQIFTGTRRRWAVYTPYAGNVGIYDFKVNWPWFALASLAIGLGVVGLYRGRPRFAVAAIVLGALDLVAVMTVVLGSPW